MFELPSAIFSIADGSEFRFARFYSVCEAAALAATRKFAHCLWFGGHTPGVFKRGRDTEWDASRGMEEIREFCFKDFAAVCLFWNFLFSGILIILLIKAVKDNKQDDVSKELDTWCDTLLLSDDERSVFFMKGYVVAAGYMGYVNGEYMLFSNEDDYREYFED